MIRKWWRSRDGALRRESTAGTHARIALLLCLAGVSAAARAQQLPFASSLPETQTCSRGTDSTTNVALNCTALVPVPDLASATGVVALLPARTPFGVATTIDGRPRYHLVGTFAGLPDPHALGNYTGYVAWAYTLALDSAVKLGMIHNGRVDLGELDYVQFRILVSAERAPSAASARGGRLVLRGTSPSARLMTHRDLLQPSAPGALESGTAAMAMTRERDTAPRAQKREAALHWSASPMAPQMPMMPGMSGLTPPVTPFLPSAAAARVPLARPRELVRLANGDTLVLTAGKVMRTIDGNMFTMYGFNGQYPGPLLEVQQGATIVVQYHNALDEPSSVHWHGVRLDNRFDGTVGVTQQAVPPGGSFAYTVHFPDAGIYWYHPHVREDIQQDLGLYGNILVRSPSANYYGDAVSREEVLALGDISMNDAGLVPYGTEAPTHALMGRFGNLFLINGAPRYTLDVDRDDVVRFLLTNASNARMYNLSFGDARMKVIASDLGKFEREEWVQSVPIAPAERYVVDVKFGHDGRLAIVNRVQALAHIAGTYSAEIDTVGMVRATARSNIRHAGREFERLHVNKDVERDLAPFRKYFAKPVDHSLVLTFVARELPSAVSNMLLGINAAVEWNDGMPMMNWLVTGRQVRWILRDPATGKENMDIDWHFTQGDVVKLRLFNDPASSHAMQHPIHLHGQRFLVLSRDGVSNTNLGWKDTAVIPAGETVDLLVDMSNPGRWMLHCHVAEHLSAGMMTVFTVRPRDRQTPAKL